MSNDTDPSIEHEPPYDPRAKRIDPSEDRADRILAKHPPDPQELARTGQSVFDEPDIHHANDHEMVQQDWSCSRCDYNLKGLPFGHPCPECGYVELYRPPPAASDSYQTWLQQRLMRVSPATGWYVAAVAVLLGGPWSALATLIGTGGQRSVAQLGTLVAVIVIGPAVEEVMKIAAAAFVVEQRPYLYQRESQLMFSAAGSAFVFAAIENFFYLNLFFSNPTLSMVLWRWTICVALHVSCSLVASRGLVRVWQQAIQEYRRPRITRALPMLTWAIVIHGSYNACAFFYEWARG
jgi:hypothetical protein